MSFEYYENAINEALDNNSTMYLDKLLSEKKFINCIELTSMMIKLETIWNKYKNFDVQIGVLICENEQSNEEGETNNLFNYKFENDIKHIIQDGKNKSCIYTIDKSGNLIEKNFCKKVNTQIISTISNNTISIAFYLGIKGIDTFIDGKPFQISNHLDKYKDIIHISTWKGINEYKEILESFFHKEVQFDPFKRYFIDKTRYPKNIHPTLDKHPKALYSKPEIIFQKNLIYYLKNNCKDLILEEVHNVFNERYDIWVLAEDRKIYVFEIKWLGRSISPEGSIFSKYNTFDRAFDGAYQLKDYVDNSDNYYHLRNGNKIYCGILITFDARDIMDDIEFDEIFNDYPQLDLSQHFKIVKDKTKASQVYKSMKKATSTI